MLFPKSYDIKINDIVKDKDGRYIILSIESEEWQFTLCNVYAPTKDKSNEQLIFFNEIFLKLKDYEDKNLIIGGDFNVCLNPILDKAGGELDSKSPSARLIENVCEDLNVNDIWRTLNPDTKCFSRRANTRGGIVQSRLDYWLVSLHMIYNIVDTDIKPAIKSDHSLLTLSFKHKSLHSRGKGF